MDYAAIFKSFIESFVQPDAEWLVYDSDVRCTYWQHHLAQNYEIHASDGDNIHLISAIAVVIGVTEPEKALKLCNDLNQYTGNFSFAYNEESAAVFSLCSVTAGPWENLALHRFALATIDQAWLSDRLSLLISEVVGGEVNYWSPREDGAMREWPDVNFHQQTAVRSRPEWISEILPWEFPTGLELGEFIEGELVSNHNFSGIAGESFELDQVADTEILYKGRKTGDYLRVLWIADKVYGTTFSSELRIVENGVVTLRSANDFIWAMAGSTTGQLMSGIFTFNAGICFRSILPAWQIRKMIEDLDPRSRSPKFLAQHLDLLKGIYFHSIQARRSEWQGLEESSVDASDTARSFIDALDNFGQELLDDPEFGKDESPVDRRLLWIAEEDRIFSYGFFNPMGPTYGVIFTSPVLNGTKRALVHIMRHTVSPVYEVLGHFETNEDLFALLERSAAEILNNAPTWLSFSSPSANDVAEEIRSAIVQGLALSWRQEIESGELLAKANRIKTFGLTPWEYASHEPEKQDVIAHFSPGSDPLQSYLAAAEDAEMQGEMLSTLSYAWDGSLNFLESNGALALEMMDFGPYQLTFSNLGFAK